MMSPARGALAVWALATLLSAVVCKAAEQDLAAKVAALKQRALKQAELLDALIEKPPMLPGAQSRRLLVAQTTQLFDGMPSIYGNQDGLVEYDFKTVNGTRKYTFQEEVQESLRHVWLILMGAVAFVMQIGFAFLEAGTARFVHVEHALMKNILTTLISAIMWWLIGYSFAMSGRFREDDLVTRAGKPLFKDNALIGTNQFIGHHFLFGRPDGQVEPTAALVEFFFQWTFCATATTIATGAMLERVRLPAYLLFSIVMSGVIYPIAAAWTVGNGWLADTTSAGYYDWAGGGYVHMLGGTVGLIAAIVSGPRESRFDEDTDFKTRMSTVPEQFWPHSQPFIVLGTMLIWFGFYGIFCGANNIVETVEQGFMTAHVAMVLTMAATVGGATAACMRFVHIGQQYDTGVLCNGIITGIVSVAAGCATMSAGEAVAAAMIGAIIYYAVSAFLKAVRVDDPLDVFAVHGAPGIWSLFAALLFDWAERFTHFSGFAGFRCYRTSPATGPDTPPVGVFSEENCIEEEIVQAAFAANIYLILSVIALAIVFTLVCLLPMRFLGVWRTPVDLQARGHDPELYGNVQAYTPYWQKGEAPDDENYL